MSYGEKLPELVGSINRIREAGCLVKDLRAGLVDFPHLKEGRELYLRWEPGEQEILFWHKWAPVKPTKAAPRVAKPVFPKGCRLVYSATVVANG